MSATFKLITPLAALAIMTTVAVAQTSDTDAAPVNDDPAGQGSVNVGGDPNSNINPDPDADTATADGNAASGGLTTKATADIAGPITEDDIAQGTVVMALTGEIVGKVVSTVVSDTETRLVVQVEGTEADSPEKNVVLPMTDFMKVGDGNFTVDATMEQFMMLVEEQNPA